MYNAVQSELNFSNLMSENPNHTKVSPIFSVLGIGGFLHIYELHSNSLVLKKEIFEGQKIYGFKINTNGTKLIIYGGKNIVIAANLNEHKELNIIQSKILSDWILDAKWIEKDEFITVSMHNKITMWTENIINNISVKCEERCILYSAHICYDNYKDIIIFSGTVFSEVLVWKPYYRTKEGSSPVLKRLNGHKGVIFSLHCNLDNGLLCSTSDDRSAILWKVNNGKQLQNINPANCDQLEIISSCQVYGHLSRVFRCFVLSGSFVTAGEDSLLIFWSFDGKMLRKIDTHQGGPIWSLDYDSNKDLICTGGQDGGVSLFRKDGQLFTDNICLPNAEVPRTIGMLKSGNMIVLSETATVYYYHKASIIWKEISRHNDLKSYSILQISPCKKLVALAGFEGQIYIYYDKNYTLKKMYTYNLKSATRIFSFHWVSCKIFLVCQNEGRLHLCFFYEQKIKAVQTFFLPKSKERWSSCACFINDHIIVGDRNGSVYNFRLGTQNFINCIKKCHSHLGIARLYTYNNTIISLGRDGILKRYKLFNGYLECIGSNKTKLTWLAALEGTYLLSFSGKNFLISDLRLQRVLYETQCGGGHRSWDYLIDSRTFIFCFIKNKVINLVKLSLEDIVPRDVIRGYHVHEINCVKAINLKTSHILISGGEDTVLRISKLQNDASFEVMESFKVHLSSIRSIFLYKLAEKESLSKRIEYLLFTGGGREQIMCWYFAIEISNLKSMVITCSEKYNFYEPLGQDKVETRIMDLSVLETNGHVILFSGCSDGSIKIFSLSDKMELKYQRSIFYSFHSVIKIVNICILNKPLLLSMDTNGNLLFWNIIDIFNCDNLSPFSSYKIHQSGINSYSYKMIKDKLLFLSGGDDNSVILSVFKLSVTENSVNVVKLSSFEDKQIHCAQITGVYLGDTYFVSCSIDQRIIIWGWTYLDDNVSFRFIQKYITTVADPQGLECFVKDNCFNLYIYGIGIEHLRVNIDQISVL